MTPEEESRHWIVRCRACGYETNIHALGGTRYRARGDGKKPRIECPNCGPRQRTVVEWRPPVG